MGLNRLGRRHIVCWGPILYAFAMLQAIAAPQPLLWLDIPPASELARTVQAIKPVLQTMYEVQWEDSHKSAFLPSSRPIGALVTGTESSLLRNERFRLDEYLEKGNGLVYIASARREDLETNNSVLQQLGVQAREIQPKKTPVQFSSHPITEGLNNLLALGGLRIALWSEELFPLAKQNSYIVGLAGICHKGRIVILCSPLVTSAQPEINPQAPQARLLLQAIQWAAAPHRTNEALPRQGMPVTMSPPYAASYKPVILTDMPDSPAWAHIRDAVSRQLEALQMPVEPVQYQKGQRTLATALFPEPALLVIASFREYEPEEQAALTEYVRQGGSLLVLGYMDRSVKGAIQQIIWLNQALGEFGLTFTSGRPAGKGKLAPHPLTANMSAPGDIGPGGSVWAFGQQPLAFVGEWPLASAIEFGRGRIIVLDASTLLPATPQQPNDNVWAEQLLRQALRWLTGR